MKPHRFSLVVRPLAAALFLGASAFSPLAHAQSASGVIAFTSTSYGVTEGNNTNVTVTRTGGGAGAISVDFTVAAPNLIPFGGTLNWADGDTADKTFSVFISNNTTVQGNVTGQLILQNPTGGATLGGGSTATLLVVDDETPATQPTISIASPPTNITVTVGTLLSLSASVDDPSNLLREVQFFLNGQPVGRSTGSGPYTLKNVPALQVGVFELKAVLIDALGGQSVSMRTVTVVAPDPAAPPPPAASILTDLNGRLLAAGATFTLSASALSPNGDELTRVDFYADGTLFASFKPSTGNTQAVVGEGQRVTRRETAAQPNNAIFQAKYIMPNSDKLVNLVMVAVDKLGRSQTSAPVSVKAVASTTDKPPVVKIRNTAPRTRVNKPVTIPVDISDPDAAAGSSAGGQPVRRAFESSGVIARIEYFINQTKVKEATAAPFTFDFTPATTGAYVATTIATDGAGLATISDPVNIVAVSDSDPLGTVVNLAVGGDAALIEGGKNGKAIFTRAGGDLTQPLTVFFKLKGAAKNGKDYRDISGQPLGDSITFAAGETKLKLKIVPRDNNKAELTEKLNLILLPSPTGDYDLGSSTKAKFLILDND
jgi:hypothetical protein